MFLAPAVRRPCAAVGSALVVAGLLNIKHGFGFSAGLIDFLVNMHLATTAGC